MGASTVAAEVRGELGRLGARGDSPVRTAVAVASGGAAEAVTTVGGRRGEVGPSDGGLDPGEDSARNNRVRQRHANKGFNARTYGTDVEKACTCSRPLYG